MQNEGILSVQTLSLGSERKWYNTGLRDPQDPQVYNKAAFTHSASVSGNGSETSFSGLVTTLHDLGAKSS